MVHSDGALSRLPWHRGHNVSRQGTQTAEVFAQSLETELVRSQGEMQKIINRVRALTTLIPDLSVEASGWGEECFVSQKVNTDSRDVCFATAIKNRRLVYAMPFMEIDGEVIYSKPSRFLIGEEGNGKTLTLSSDWRDRMQHAGIAETIIEKVSQYIRDHYPTD